MSDKTLTRKVDKAIFRFKLIEPGDRILIALSGGKDSLTMAWFLGHKKKGFPIPFDLGGIHLEGDFPGCGKSSVMASLMNNWGIPFEIVKIPVVKRLKPGQTMNCYWCSTQRRMELIEYARKHGYNKIALGHHMDDILETFFMNMLQKRELSTMLPKLVYDHYPYTVIRPLAYLKEEEIRIFARDKGLLEAAALCEYGNTSSRLNAQKMLQAITAIGGPAVRDSIFEAMCHPVHRYMPYSLLAGERESTKNGKKETCHPGGIDGIPV